MTVEARFLKKDFDSLNLGSAALKQAQNGFFRHFPEFESLVFFQSTYNNSLQQCLISSRGKTHERNFGAKIRPEISFFCHFLKLGSLVFLEIAYNDSLQQCLTSGREKTHKKKFGARS